MMKTNLLAYVLLIVGVFAFVPAAHAWECYVDPVYERNLCGRYKIAAYVLEKECSGTAKLETVPAGTVLPIIAETDGWYKVKTLNNVIGWTGSSLMEVVSCDLLTKASTASTTPKTTTTDYTLVNKMKGRLLLQVESVGEIWYVSPVTGKRYLVTKENAMSLFRSLSLGITNANLAKIPIYQEKQHSNYMDLRYKVKGRLLLAVEDSGRIWYVHPDSLWRREVTKDGIMDIFRAHSLGITNANLAKIPVGDVNVSEVK